MGKDAISMPEPFTNLRKVLFRKRLGSVVDAEVRGFLDTLVDALHSLLLSTQRHSARRLRAARATRAAARSSCVSNYFFPFLRRKVLITSILTVPGVLTVLN